MIIPLNDSVFVHPMPNVNSIRHHIDHRHSTWTINPAAFQHSHRLVTNVTRRHTPLKIRVIEIREVWSIFIDIGEGFAKIAAKANEGVE